MKAIYFLVSSSSWYKENPLKVFTEYFEKQGGFTDAFLMAAIVAAVVCALLRDLPILLLVVKGRHMARRSGADGMYLVRCHRHADGNP